MNRKAEILYKLGESLAAGMYEDENASIAERYGRGLRRYFEHAGPPPENGLLYPTLKQNIWRLSVCHVRFHYSYSFHIDADGLRRAGEERLDDPFEKELLERIIGELTFFRSSLIAPRYRIGGNGWTHTVLNYPRILREGLGRYIERVNAMSASPLKKALQDTLKGICSFLKRSPGTIRDEVMNPAADFRSAIRSFNFFFALDAYDSAGRFDDYLGEYYQGEKDASAYLEELFQTMDIHCGWHLLHTSKYPEFTALCLKA
jgi:formate C-acetyltransferase